MYKLGDVFVRSNNKQLTVVRLTDKCIILENRSGKQFRVKNTDKQFVTIHPFGSKYSETYCYQSA